MTISKKHPMALLGLLITILLTAMLLPSVGVSAEKGSTVAEGKALAFSRKKGNCLACHMMDDGQSPGNIAPPLIAMQSRYKTKELLREQIWDATTANPDSPMPPFGKHQVISESEIDKIVDYVWTL